MAMYAKYLGKSCHNNYICTSHKYTKSLFKSPGFLFECFCDHAIKTIQLPKSLAEESQMQNLVVAKVHFFRFLFIARDINIR